jgi:cytochrome c-type biogenesis protein CcmE
MKKSTLAGIVLMLGFGALGAGAFKKAVTPYVSVPEARASQDVVQVYGAIDQGRMHYNSTSGVIEFPLTDLKNHTMKVEYRGIRPGNMAQATHCVATGRWSGDHFEAATLLIKCPSKYQGEKAT